MESRRLCSQARLRLPLTRYACLTSIVNAERRYLYFYNKDIVLAKLRPGQVIDVEMHAIKGVGKEHAKWSPVGEHPVPTNDPPSIYAQTILRSATAAYRLYPLASLNPARPIPPWLAQDFAKCFAPGAVKINEHGEVYAPLLHPTVLRAELTGPHTIAGCDRCRLYAQRRRHA